MQEPSKKPEAMLVHAVTRWRAVTGHSSERAAAKCQEKSRRGLEPGKFVNCFFGLLLTQRCRKKPSLSVQVGLALQEQQKRVAHSGKSRDMSPRKSSSGFLKLFGRPVSTLWVMQQHAFCARRRLCTRRLRRR